MDSGIDLTFPSIPTFAVLYPVTLMVGIEVMPIMLVTLMTTGFTQLNSPGTMMNMHTGHLT